jgi:predicted ATP-grasp superfamily ATP-dependent carboligase
MLRILVYEFVTGGGCWSLGDEPPGGSLLAEGRAMRDALASDFAALAEVAQVRVLHDVRLSPPDIDKLETVEIHSAAEEWELLGASAAAADVVVLIAPEFSGLLLKRVLLVEQVGAPLFSPGADFVRLATDKSATANYLAAKGIRVPRGMTLRQRVPERIDLEFPAVLKPNDGAGSTGVRRMREQGEFREVDLTQAERWRLEELVPGVPASVALLAGPRGVIPLQPCSQNLSDDGRFIYLGGVTPLPSPLSERAARLALQVAEALPQTRGFFGIDMVLGSAENGAEDFVVEINPRLTTSYLGLRRACKQNLARAMLQCVRGGPVALSYRAEQVDFTPETDRVSTC